MYLYIHVLHKINNADKLTDNRFKFNKNFFLSFYRKYEHFLFVVLSQFVIILIDVDFKPLGERSMKRVHSGIAVLVSDLTFGQKGGKLEVWISNV